MPGRSPFELTTTTRSNHAEVVLLRLEQTCTSYPTKPSPRSHSKKARAISEREGDGFENKVERRYAIMISYFRKSVPKEGSETEVKTKWPMGDSSGPDVGRL